MKAIVAILFMTIGLVACNNEGSAEREIDSLSTRIDTTAEKVWDTLKKETKELKEEVKEEWKSRKDSVSRDSAR